VCFAVITLCVVSQRVFVIVYFVMTQSGNFWLYPRITAPNEFIWQPGSVTIVRNNRHIPSLYPAGSYVFVLCFIRLSVLTALLLIAFIIYVCQSIA
jgi:hypothetical protein